MTSPHTPLTADQAIEIVTTGAHAQAELGSVEVDVTMIDMIRNGYIICSLDAEGVLCIQPTDKLHKLLGN